MQSKQDIEKAERQERIERFATKAMSVVRVRDADLMRLTETGRKILAEQIAFDAFEIAEAMEAEFQRRMKR